MPDNYSQPTSDDDYAYDDEDDVATDGAVALDDTQPKPRYRRILLKVSGEALAGDLGSGIDPQVVHSIADQIKEVVDNGVQVAIVVGGAISGEVSRPRPRVWTAPPPTTWEC